LINQTVSCTRVYNMTKLHTHCGCCSQCIDRRFAILAANAAHHDPVEKYKVELFSGQRDKADDQTMAESYVRAALELRELGDVAFFGRFGGETARVLPCIPSLNADEVGRLVFDLHQKHAEAIWGVLKAAVERHSAELVDGSLPPSSLLMMTVSAGRTPTLERMGKSADPIQSWVDEVEAEGASTDGGSGGHVPDWPRDHPQRPRGGSRPALERARGGIKELYPHGVPDQATEPNAILCRKVGDWLKSNSMPEVSDPTILRAARRRK
jgi:hypothetical protein